MEHNWFFSISQCQVYVSQPMFSCNVFSSVTGHLYDDSEYPWSIILTTFYWLVSSYRPNLQDTISFSILLSDSCALGRFKYSPVTGLHATSGLLLEGSDKQTNPLQELMIWNLCSFGLTLQPLLRRQDLVSLTLWSCSITSALRKGIFNLVSSFKLKSQGLNKRTGLCKFKLHLSKLRVWNHPTPRFANTFAHDNCLNGQS